MPLSVKGCVFLSLILLAYRHIFNTKDTDYFRILQQRQQIFGRMYVGFSGRGVKQTNGKNFGSLKRDALVPSVIIGQMPSEIMPVGIQSIAKLFGAQIILIIEIPLIQIKTIGF